MAKNFLKILHKGVDKAKSLCYTISRRLENNHICGSGSVVERHLAKVNVASSNLVFRFHSRGVLVTSLDYSNRKYFRRHSQVVRHGSATPLSPVQVWVAPSEKSIDFVGAFFNEIRLAACEILLRNMK